MAGPRVAYVLLWFPEPTETFILDEVNTQVALGLDLAVYTLYGPLSPSRVGGMGPVAAPVIHLGTSSLGALLKDLLHLKGNWGAKAGRFLRKGLLRRWRSPETAGEAVWAALAGVSLARKFLAAGIDHIHAPWADGPATAAWVASELSGIPFSFCARAHDLYPPDGALREKLNAAVLVRTNNRANHRYLARFAPEAAAKMVTIYNGIPLAAEPTPQPAMGPPYRLLALGRMVPKKGYHILLEACRRLKDKGLDFHLTLAGEGPKLQQLQTLARDCGLEARVAFPGFIPYSQVPGLFRQADLFLMPSVVSPSGDRDGIPNVILESLLHEVPVVATAVSGLPEVIVPGETGWLVPPEDPGALAQAVLEALADPAEARRRAREGRRFVLREFDSSGNYGRLKACFESLAPGPESSAG